MSCEVKNLFSFTKENLTKKDLLQFFRMDCNLQAKTNFFVNMFAGSHMCPPFLPKASAASQEFASTQADPSGLLYFPCAAPASSFFAPSVTVPA